MPDTLPVWYAFRPRSRTPERVVHITTAVLNYLRSEGVYNDKHNRCLVRTFDSSFEIGLGDSLVVSQLADIERIIKECSGCEYAIEHNKRVLRIG